MNRHDTSALLADLQDIARRAADAEVSKTTQQAIDYAVRELAAETRPSTPSTPPTEREATWEDIKRKFRKSREILRGVK